MLGDERVEARRSLMVKSTQYLEVESRRVAVSNLDKVLYPAAHVTKRQVIDYYAVRAIHPTLLHLMVCRPLPGELQETELHINLVAWLRPRHG